MTEDLNVFPNADSTLFGAGEDSVGIIVTPATAGLTGSVVLNEGSVVSDNTVGNESRELFLNRGSEIAGTVLATCALGSLVDGDKVVLSFSYFFPTNWAIQKNGSTIFSGTGPSLPQDSNRVGSQLFIDDITVDASYTYTLITTLEGGQFFSMLLKAVKIGVTDTHAGFIQTVAVAGKQINAADSHTTREISVLPG